MTRHLNEKQFDDAFDIEEQQRRRFRRKHESGYVGNGYHFANYPYMIGALGAGSLISTTQEHEQLQDQDDARSTAPVTTGMAEGGTAMTGLAGGAVA